MKSTEELAIEDKCFCKRKSKIINLNECTICRVWKKCSEESWNRCKK